MREFYSFAVLFKRNDTFRNYSNVSNDFILQFGNTSVKMLVVYILLLIRLLLGLVLLRLLVERLLGRLLIRLLLGLVFQLR
jgi:hypothetical protein